MKSLHIGSIAPFRPPLPRPVLVRLDVVHALIEVVVCALIQPTVLWAFFPSFFSALWHLLLEFLAPF